VDYLKLKEPPKREDRHKTCIAYGGTICGLNKKARTCMDDGERAFTQGNICLLLPALGILNSLPDNVVLLHGALGCGSSTHAQNAGIRSGNNARFGQVQDGLWVTTGLDEGDVISGGEEKLAAALKEIDLRYRPETITVVATCVPGITGDDIEGLIAKIQPEVNAIIIPVHCEGFKTKIWATSYDAVYHGMVRHLLDKNPLAEKPEEKEKWERIVNLMNVSSMGRVDELELQRLLQALGLEVNFFPVFSRPKEFYQATKAALSISTCPTHDDYLLKFLEQEYKVPYIIRHMPIGIANTDDWLRDTAKFFGLEEEVERIIAKERGELEQALAEFKPLLQGKKAFISAGEFRALATSNLLLELGLEIVGIRSYHHDEFALVEYEKLIKSSEKDFMIGIANSQPFEEANMLRKLKPDLFLGHWCGNSTAAKSGIATHTVYNTGIQYVGYRGAYELARRIYRQLKNPAFNRNMSKYVRLPYKDEWYEENPFKYINARGGSLNE